MTEGDEAIRTELQSRQGTTEDFIDFTAADIDHAWRCPLWRWRANEESFPVVNPSDRVCRHTFNTGNSRGLTKDHVIIREENLDLMPVAEISMHGNFPPAQCRNTDVIIGGWA